jgi:hypothetical protein
VATSTSAGDLLLPPLTGADGGGALVRPARRAASPRHCDALPRDPVASLQDGRGSRVCILRSHGAAPSAMYAQSFSFELLNSQTFFPAADSHFIRMMHSGCGFQSQLPGAQQR